jgi:hypothetical protein
MLFLSHSDLNAGMVLLSHGDLVLVTTPLDGGWRASRPSRTLTREEWRLSGGAWMDEQGDKARG